MIIFDDLQVRLALVVHVQNFTMIEVMIGDLMIGI